MQSPQDTVPSVPSAEEHARLTDTRSRHAESLLRLSRRFESAQTYPEVLEAAREEVRSAIGYTNLWVYLISDDRKYAYALVGGGPVSGDDWMKSEMGRLTIEGDAMLEEIARATHPVVVEDARTDPRTDKKVVAALGNRTIINVPIIFSEQILGTVGTGTFGDEGVRAPSPVELEFLQSLASHMAVSLDRIRLLDRHRQTERALRRLNRELRAISGCNQALLRATDEQELLNDICRIIRDEAGYTLVWVGLADPNKRDALIPVAWSGESEELVETARTRWSDLAGQGLGLSASVLRSGEIAIVPDIATDERMESSRDDALAVGLRSGIAIPLKASDNKVFGCLTAYATEARVVSPSDRILLEGLTEDLAFGISVLRNRKALEQAEREQATHLWFLGSLDRVNRAIQGAGDLDQMMRDVLDVLITVFGCDRAWMVYPCDPDAKEWQTPMERTRPEYPGVLPLGVNLPLDPEGSVLFGLLRASDGPLQFGPGQEHTVPPPMAKAFGVRSLVAMALDPRIGARWAFGLHQCSHERVWSDNEMRLFQEIGRRLTDALTTLLTLRDLQRSGEQYRSLAEGSPDNIIRYDVEGRITYLNENVDRSLGYPMRSFLGMIPPVDPAREEQVRSIALIRQVCETGQPADIEVEIIDSAGEKRTHHVLCVPEFGREGTITGVLAFGRDITERKRDEEALKRSLTEKEVLLKEIHHRVKNNLQIITSLLNLQARDLGPGPARAALQESQARVRSMALVHETFYRASDFAHVDLHVYSDTLTTRIAQASIRPGITVHASGSSALVGIDTAVPVGLILNELVTNALKHGFEGRTEGHVHVDVRRRDEKTVELTVEDDGIGLPAGTDVRAISSMGMTLVVGLVEQLMGTMAIDRNNGTKFTIAFPA
ncbi:MAG: GAF domain-containing protein [Ignavibacteriae bacterium]|nr:GAF domain-containing protein [Ignavibacteriota bacterium]